MNYTKIDGGYFYYIATQYGNLKNIKWKFNEEHKKIGEYYEGTFCDYAYSVAKGIIKIIALTLGISLVLYPSVNALIILWCTFFYNVNLKELVVPGFLGQELTRIGLFELGIIIIFLCVWIGSKSSDWNSARIQKRWANPAYYEQYRKNQILLEMTKVKKEQERKERLERSFFYQLYKKFKEKTCIYVKIEVETKK